MVDGLAARGMNALATEGGLFALADDLPKKDPWRDDRLGFAPFAERLAKVIEELVAPNGYVIGLHGEWGSGKSTVLNFVNAYLEKHNQETGSDDRRIIPIDFRPWIISGHQDLVAAFFKVLSERLAGRTGWWKRQLNRVLRIFGYAADPLLDAVAVVAITIDPSGGVASKAVATVAKKSVGGMIDRFLADPSLQAAYGNLKKVLNKSGKRFLVNIDDLDRLHDDEIRSVMQMVKTVGQLPNVIYLLAYDRTIVWKAIDGYLDRVSPRYAEKIVQQEIELPKPSRHDLLAILDADIKFLNGEIPDSVRWQYILRDGVRRWIRHPRDALRLANAVKFSWPALKGELDPQDLLAMEGLRLFDGAAFDWVRWNRDFLFREGRFLFKEEEQRKTSATRLRERLPKDTCDEILSIFSVLFPSNSKDFVGNDVSSEPDGNVVKRRGVGCEAGYDAYFALHPSPDSIPKAVIDEMISALKDDERLYSALDNFVDAKDRRGQPQISLLLEELRYRFQGEDHAAPTQQMLDALFQVGERVLRIEWRERAFELSPRLQLSFLIGDLLKIWGPEEGGRHLKEAFEKSTSVFFTAQIFVDRARELGAIPAGGSRSPPVITIDNLRSIGRPLRPRIEEAARDGTLARAPFYWAIALCWKNLGGAADAKSWLSAGVQASAEFLARATLGLVAYTISTPEPIYSMTERPDADLYDLDVMLAACKKHLAGKDLNRDQRNRVEVVAQAIEQGFAGKPPIPT